MVNIKTLLIIMVTLLSACGQRRINEITPPDPSKLPSPKYVADAPAPKDELIVWRGGSVTKSVFRKNIQERFGNDITVQVCESCDGKLELWKGKAIELLLSGETVRNSSEKPRAQGEDTLFYSRNFYIKTPIDKDANVGSLKQPVITHSGEGQKLVAVLDTGIDTNYIRVDRNKVTCKERGLNGWNFVENNNMPIDDHMYKHGTIVTKYIIDNAGSKPIDILPVKVLGKDGSGDLFKFLCGVAYAFNSGANVINASLGFYYYDSVPPVLLERYLSEYLVKGRILICAAGNADKASDDTMIAMYGNIIRPYLRNIDVHYFYPAGLSDKNGNIITVTTVAKNNGVVKVSSSQNYSKHKVTFGVEGDNNFFFRNPLSPNESISGSSYAAPIFTGVFVKYNFSPEASEDFNLRHWVKNGKYLRRD